LGLSTWQRLRLIDLPLASRNILAGIKTSAIINIGTATLAALIGAGGYGAPIVTGLALNDMRTILSGAIPAAVMALLASAAFEGLNRMIIPKGLRVESSRESC
jgi:osmoprotectant transport system permease protein